MTLNLDITELIRIALEYFATYYQSNTEKYDKLSKIGTAIHIAANDYFKFATLNLKKKIKRFLTYNMEDCLVIKFLLQRIM